MFAAISPEGCQYIDDEAEHGTAATRQSYHYCYGGKKYSTQERFTVLRAIGSYRLRVEPLYRYHYQLAWYRQRHWRHGRQSLRESLFIINGRYVGCRLPFTFMGMFGARRE